RQARHRVRRCPPRAAGWGEHPENYERRHSSWQCRGRSGADLPQGSFSHRCGSGFHLARSLRIAEPQSGVESSAGAPPRRAITSQSGKTVYRQLVWAASRRSAIRNSLESTQVLRKRIVTDGLKLLTLLDLLATFRLRVFSLAAALIQEAPQPGTLHGVRREANFPHEGRWYTPRAPIQL